MATSTSGRFIPRGELSSFAAWTPSEMAGAPGAAAPLRRGFPQAPERRASPEETPVAELLRAARQSGYQDGYRDGMAALEGFKQSFARQTTLSVGALVASMGGALDALQRQLADSVARTALLLARGVVRSELAARPEAVATIAAEAVEQLALAARHVTVRVHPDDVAHVAAGAGELLAARGARVVGDAQVTRGGCRVDSEVGRIDAGIEGRWTRAAAALGSELGWDEPATDATGVAPGGAEGAGAPGR